MLSVEVEGIDGGVPLHILLVIRNVLCTHTEGKLKIFQDVPLVLQVDAQLVVAHHTRWRGVVVEAIGERHGVRCLTVQEAVKTVEAVVARTVTHVVVLCLHMLETETSRDLVATGIVSEVIRQVRGLRIHHVVVGEQLISRTDIRLEHTFIIHDVNEGEVAGVGATTVIEVRIGEEQLVGCLRTETTVQIGRE